MYNMCKCVVLKNKKCNNFFRVHVDAHGSVPDMFVGHPAVPVSECHGGVVGPREGLEARSAEAKNIIRNNFIKHKNHLPPPVTKSNPVLNRLHL